MNFEKDSFFAPSIITTYNEDWDEEWHHLNPTAEAMNKYTSKLSSDKTRQQGYELAVYESACNPDGSPRFRGKVMQADFFQNVDRVKARDFGMVICGFKQGDEKSEFEEEVQDIVGNSKPEKAATSG